MIFYYFSGLTRKYTETVKVSYNILWPHAGGIRLNLSPIHLTASTLLGIEVENSDKMTNKQGRQRRGDKVKIIYTCPDIKCLDRREGTSHQKIVL